MGRKLLCAPNMCNFRNTFPRNNRIIGKALVYAPIVSRLYDRNYVTTQLRVSNFSMRFAILDDSRERTDWKRQSRRYWKWRRQFFRHCSNLPDERRQEGDFYQA